MTISFVNNYRDVVHISINNGDFVCVQPCTKLSFACEDCRDLSVLVKPNGKSYHQKKPDAYILKMESLYMFSGVCDGEIFVINREKIRISSHTYYDRLFVKSANAFIKYHKNVIMQEEEIKSHYRKSRLIDMLIIEPLLDYFFLDIGLLLVGIILAILGGWKAAIVYFPLSYILVLLINMASESFVGAVSKKLFKYDEKSEFYAFFNSGFIDNYYRNPQREAYLGDIEID